MWSPYLARFFLSLCYPSGYRKVRTNLSLERKQILNMVEIALISNAFIKAFGISGQSPSHEHKEKKWEQLGLYY